MATLFHTTDRRNVPSISEQGWQNNEDGFVHLTDRIWSWHQNWVLPLESIGYLGKMEVVFVFDFPDKVADPFMVEAKPIKADDPEFDPELDQFDELGEDSVLWREWHIPAELVNRHFSGIAFWSGDCPVTADQLRDIWRRRFDCSGSS